MMMVMSFGQCIKVADKWLQAIIMNNFINRFCFLSGPQWDNACSYNYR